MKKINFKPLEIEEIFLDDNVDDVEMKKRKIEAPLERKKFYFLYLVIIFVFLFLLAFTFKFQVINHNKYSKLAEDNKYLSLKIEAERGIIYDKNMEQLVFNEIAFDLWLDKKNVSDQEIKEIGDILGKNFKELEKESREDKIMIANNLSRYQLVLLETKFSESQSLEIIRRIKRKYFPEESLSHILGYTGKISPQELKENDNYEITDYLGKEGLEKSYNNFLAENKGIMEIERNAQGKIISQKVKKEPSSGNDLILNLDLELQKKTAEVLNKILREEDIPAAGAVILKPDSGKVLSMVSLPSFDNNLFASGISEDDLKELNENPAKPQLNRVINGLYSSGSTIKPFIGLAALEEGIITENTNFFCPEKLCLENKYSQELECFSDWEFHGWTTIRRAIAESVNPFFYIIGGGYEKPREHNVDPRIIDSFEGLGSEKIAQWLRNFGWGEETDIDLPSEAEGRVPTPQWKKEYFSDSSLAEQGWYSGDTYNLSIGQGYILATPIQLAVALQGIVNEGKIFKPRLVDKIILADGEKNIEKELLNNLSVSPYNAQIIREGMKQAVKAGSATMLNSLPVSLGAKTGTAQTPREDVYHNWIALFAPYENPEMIMVLMMENVEGARIVVQKAAYEILNWYFNKN